MLDLLSILWDIRCSSIPSVGWLLVSPGASRPSSKAILSFIPCIYIRFID
jgi:hypothetical protein